jgi:hypothetical protein
MHMAGSCEHNNEHLGNFKEDELYEVTQLMYFV